jgi:hypothetical protein
MRQAQNGPISPKPPHRQRLAILAGVLPLDSIGTYSLLVFSCPICKLLIALDPRYAQSPEPSERQRLPIGWAATAAIDVFRW